RVTRAVVRTDERRCAIGEDIERRLRWDLADPINGTRIAGILLVVRQRFILLELGVLLRVLHINRAYGEAAAKDPLLPGMPDEADPRLNVIVVAPAESARGMDQSAHSARERVDRFGIKIRLLDHPWCRTGSHSCTEPRDSELE